MIRVGAVTNEAHAWCAKNSLIRDGQSHQSQKRRKLFSTGGAPSSGNKHEAGNFISALVRQGHAYNIATVRSFAGGARAPGAPPLPPPMQSTMGY